MTNDSTSKNLAGQVLDGKYELIAPLGEGGMAVVYRARRLKIDDLVAVKILRPEITFDAVSQTRFEREAQSAARIKHPNIVTIHDFGTTGEGLTYLVMELLEGPTLDEELRNCVMLPIERAVNILTAVCQAIGAAHREGIIHRDLKPSNILLHRFKDGSEIVKVVDFGIVKLGRTSERLTQVNNLLGTPHYMSPEQCINRELDERSDIYTLGIIAYELLTGVLPFDEPSILEILQAHMETPPPSMRERRAEIPAELEAAVFRALNKEIEDRPASAAEFANELMGAVGPAALPAPVTPVSLKKKTAEMLSPVSQLVNRNTGNIRLETINRKMARPVPDFEQFVGRKREMERLIAEFQQLQLGRARPVVLLGEQGIGLSRLAEEFKRWGRKQDAHVLVARFQEPLGQAVLPLQHWLDLLRRVIKVSRKDITNDMRLAELIAERTGVELPACLLENRTLNDAEKWRSFEAISTVLLRTLGDKVGVLIFDNLHFAHGLGLELIAYLIRNCRARIMFIFMARAEQASQKGHPLYEWISQLSRSGGCEILRLQPLTEQEARQVLEAIFGRLQIAERDIERLWMVSQGNPYYMGEIVRLLINEGKIELRDEQWHCDDIGDFTLPESLHQLADVKLARLDEALVELLRQAAVIGNEFTFDQLEIVSGSDEDKLGDLLETAVKAHVIVESQKRDESYRFQDPTLQLVLYESIPRRRRRKLHLQVAQAIEEITGTNRQKLERQSARLLHHYHEAGQLLETFRYGRAAADAARSRQALAEAESYYDWALAAAGELAEEETPPDASEWAQLYLGSAEIYFYLGRLDDADRSVNEAQKLARTANNDKLVGRAQLIRCQILYSRSMLELALGAAEAGLNAAQAAGETVLESHLLLMLARIYRALGRTEEALDALECNLEIAKQLGDPATENQVLALMGSMLGHIGIFDQGISFGEEALRQARTHKDRIGELMALLYLGNNYLQTAQFEHALECYDLGLELARTLEHRMLEGAFHNGLGDVYRSLGDIEMARDCYQQYHAISQSSGNQSGEAIANYKLGLVALDLGILPDALRRLEEASTQHQRMGGLRTLAEVYCGLGQAREQMGQIEQARTAFSNAIKHCQNINHPCCEWQAHYGLASCLATLGRIEEACTELDTALAIIERLAQSLPAAANREEYMQDKKKVQALLDDLRA